MFAGSAATVTDEAHSRCQGQTRLHARVSRDGLGGIGLADTGVKSDRVKGSEGGRQDYVRTYPYIEHGGEYSLLLGSVHLDSSALARSASGEAVEALSSANLHLTQPQPFCTTPSQTCASLAPGLGSCTKRPPSAKGGEDGTCATTTALSAHVPCPALARWLLLIPTW